MINGNGMYYPIMDRPTVVELKALGIQVGFRITSAIINPLCAGQVGVVGVKINVYRKPVEGDWFLSGATPEVFKAGCDYECEYEIMRIIVVESKLQVTEISFNRTKELTGKR